MIPSDTSALRLFPRLRPLVLILSLCISLALFGWSLYHYKPIVVPNLYGPRAIYSLMFLSLLLALLGRVLLLRLLKSEIAETDTIRRHLREVWQPLFLFDITAPLYLAAGVLIDIPAGVLIALITQMFLQGYTLLRGFVSWTEACYRVATTALSVLVSDSVYSAIAGSSHDYFVPLPVHHLTESQEFLGSILAALVMLSLITLVSFPIVVQEKHVSLSIAWNEYVHSPTLRFQALVLSVGPLLPVVDIFDNVAGELAWIFFLVPLFAIYYLALISTRLGIRTGALQRTLQDLSSTRRRRDELRDYASLITRVQEEERRRLARELHDDTAQALIALSLGLDGLGRAMRKLHVPEKDIQWLSSLQNLADSTLEGVRRACLDLRPSVLDDLGLRAALEWLSDSSAIRGVPCTFTYAGQSQPTASEAEIAIFRIVQEALSNIWRHSQATEATIELKYLPNLLQVTIQDNGKGFVHGQRTFDTSHDSHSGLGLLGMRERAALIGATLNISSSPGEGCTVELSLPL